MISLDQIRAQMAFAKADEIARNRDLREKFLTLARSLPAMFQNNGFLATWAFLLSKGEKEHEAVLDLLVKHLSDNNFDFNLPEGVTESHQLLLHWTNPNGGIDHEDLMGLTREAILFSGWIKRAAEALCDQ